MRCVKVLEPIVTRGSHNCVRFALSRATQSAKRRQCESIESWHAATRSRTHFSRSFSRRVRLLCKAAKHAVSGALRQAGSQEPRVCAPDAQQQKFNCKGKIAARGPFSVYTSVRNKATRLDWRRELAAGLQGCCTLCWPARATPRRASLGANARAASHRC